jgi:hypothetical protein
MGMFRNRIINGDFVVSQRVGFAGTVLTNTGSTLFFTDRWYFDIYGAISTLTGGSVTFEKMTDVPTGSTTTRSVRMTVAASTGLSGGAGAVCPFEQRVEGYNIADFAWGTDNGTSATVSFWTKCSIVGNHVFAIISGSGATSYVTTFAVNAANTWEYKSIVVPRPTTGSSGWNTDNTLGLSLRFYIQEFGTSSFRVSSLNTWQTAVSFGSIPPAGTTYVNTLLTTASATAFLTGVQLERGTIATPFEFRPYPIELQLCQRYYKAYTGTVPLASGMAINTTILTFPMVWDVPWRAPGSLTLVPNTGTGTIVIDASFGLNTATNLAAITVSGGNGQRGYFQCNTSGLTAFTSAMIWVLTLLIINNEL